MSIARYASRKPSDSGLVQFRDAKTPQVVIPAVYRFFAKLVGGLFGHPRLTTTVLVGWFAYVELGRRNVVIAVLVLVIGLLVWSVAHPASFRRMVWSRLRSGWRRWWVYGRQWQPVLMAHDLLITRGQTDALIPRLRWPARCNRYADELLVDLMPGMGPEDFEAEASNLAHAFGAEKCTVMVVKPGRVLLRFMQRDPLVAPVPALLIPETVDLAAVPIGRTEDGSPWSMQVQGTHLLVAGATGSGKGSVLWSLMRGLAPDIASGRVVVWGFDPKGGVELGFARAMFARFSAGRVDEMADLLEEAVTVMDTRLTRLAGHARDLVPTVDEPLIVLVIDELASLTAYVKDRDTRRRIDNALQLLLSKGRAPGIVVVGALQDPGKDVIAYRDLFPTRIALRLTEREQVAMVLGGSAWERGATCEQIPRSLPGVGFVQLDGHREPIRVRAGHVTDTDLVQLARTHPAPPASPAPVVTEPPLLAAA